MLPIGIHLSHWQTHWMDDLAPLIGRAGRLGFDVAEFPLLFPGDLDYPRLRGELDRLGMRASCGTALNPQADITSPDPQIRLAGMQHLRRCLEGAARLGSPILGGLTYAPWGISLSTKAASRRDQCIASLKDAVHIAEDNGVTICMEAVNRFEGDLVNTVRQGLEIISEVQSNHLKLHLDTFHMNIEEDALGDAIRQAGKHLGHLHCVENNRKPPGQGHIPWHAVSQAVKQISYQGYLVAEIFVNPAGEVGQGLFIWRDLAEDLDEAARQSVAFLRKEFTDV
jgi:D-psicose/D-tagatose/L-ribulose 3-epimerase